MYNKLLLPTTNPFINLAFTLEKNRVDIDNTTIDLLTSLLNSNLFEQYDINESFYTVEDYATVIKKKNVFSILSNLPLSQHLNFEKYKAFFEVLYNKGILITPDYIIKNSQTNYSQEELEKLFDTDNITLHHPIFSDNGLLEKKLLFFMSQLLENKILSKDNFSHCIEQYSTYHHIVNDSYEEAILYLSSLKISPNFIDNEGRTPIMLCKNFSTLKTFTESNPDIHWMQQDNNNKDICSVFLEIKDSDERKNMLHYAKEHIEKSINSSVLIGDQKSILIEKRNQKQLLEMVVSDKTKKEIANFIKSNTIPDINNIKDELGNNLLMICIKQNNWGKANLFLNYCDAKEINHKGEDILSIILQKKPNNLPRIEQLFPILNIALAESQYKNSDQSLFLNLLQKQLINFEFLMLPSWMMQKDSRYLETLGFNHKSAVKWHERSKLRYSHFNDTEKYHFFFEGFRGENKQFDFNFEELFDSIILKKAYDENTSRNRYSFNNTLFYNLFSFFKYLDEENIDYDKENTMNKFHKQCVKLLNEGYEHHYEYVYGVGLSNEEQQKTIKYHFIRDCMPLLHYFMDNQMFTTLTKLHDGILKYENFNDDEKKIINYIFLQKNIEDKSKNKKRSKI